MKAALFLSGPWGGQDQPRMESPRKCSKGAKNQGFLPVDFIFGHFRQAQANDDSLPSAVKPSEEGAAERGRGSDTGCPVPPSRIPACDLPAPGSSS